MSKFPQQDLFLDSFLDYLDQLPDEIEDILRYKENWHLTSTDGLSEDEIAFAFLRDIVNMKIFLNIKNDIPVRFAMRFLPEEERFSVLNMVMKNNNYSQYLIFDKTLGSVFIPNTEYHHNKVIDFCAKEKEKLDK